MNRSGGQSIEFRWPKRVKTPADALRFIDAAGFCLLFPVKNVPLPSLYFAMARRMPETWDSYAMKLWGWKADLPRRRRAFYAKYFKGRGTFISLKLLPHFLAMRETATLPEEHENFYAAGRITHDACTIWKALAENGPLPTLGLRHTCRMDSKSGNVRFKKAMNELQCLLIVTHFGAEQETAAWASGRFELTARAFRKQARQAQTIAPESARAELARKYLVWHPDAQPMVLARLFGWPKSQAVAAMAGAKSPAPRSEGRQNS
jgi:hypothetical protein